MHLTISHNALSVSFNSISIIVNLKNSPTNEFFTIEVLHITYKINEFSTSMHLKLLTISKMKCKRNHLYSKMALLLSGDINVNPGPILCKPPRQTRFLEQIVTDFESLELNNEL